MTISSSKKTHHSVLALEVTGGFLGGARLEFADGLNCLIGGRGAGKTTALEFLRFGLGLMPDPKLASQRHRSLEGLIKANLGNGSLSIEVLTKNGMRYSAHRSEAGEVQVRNEKGTPVPVTFDSDIFSADVFSQNEIEEIATDPAAQLVLLDRFIEKQMAEIRTALGSLGRELHQTSTDLLRLDKEIEELVGVASEAPTIAEKLRAAGVVAGPDADRVSAAHAGSIARAREAQVPEQLVTIIQKAVQDVSASAVAFRTSSEAHLEGLARSGSNRDVLEALEAATLSLGHVLASAVTVVEAGAADAERSIRTQQALMAERHAVQNAEYSGFVALLSEEGGRAAERKSLQQNLTKAVTAAKDQQAREKQRLAVAGKRAEMLARVSELRDQRFELRKTVADGLTARFESIRVTVMQSANLQPYKELVSNALRGARLRNVVAADRLADEFLPQELSRAVWDRDHALISKRTTFEEERARKIVEALRHDGVGYQLETVDLDDVPSIELLDGGEFKASARLSTGQRCTTILPILLVQSERPLLIDQPEDNLDNAFIYATVVKALDDVRGARQVIFVTHNPNIPVLGDAERVFVFDSDGQHAKLRRAGTVDDCKSDIETILEGGRDAFLKRKARYGH